MLTTRSLSIATTGRGTFEITAAIDEALAQTAIETGLCHVFVHHTSASLVITENADPDVRRDLEAFFWRLVPDGDPLFVHTAEGPDDMPSHIRSALTQTSLTIPSAAGAWTWGTWQGVYLWEHRHTPHQRRLTLTVQGATPAEQAR